MEDINVSYLVISETNDTQFNLREFGAKIIRDRDKDRAVLIEFLKKGFYFLKIKGI